MLQLSRSDPPFTGNATIFPCVRAAIEITIVLETTVIPRGSDQD